MDLFAFVRLMQVVADDAKGRLCELAGPGESTHVTFCPDGNVAVLRRIQASYGFHHGWAAAGRLGTGEAYAWIVDATVEVNGINTVFAYTHRA